MLRPLNFPAIHGCRVPSSRRLGKWCAIAVVLVTPGSFIVLPAIWLARNWHLVKELEKRVDWGEMREGY